MNPERDVLFLSISSHGAQDPAIAVSNSQLPLNDLTDEDLAEALNDSEHQMAGDHHFRVLCGRLSSIH